MSGAVATLWRSLAEGRALDAEALPLLAGLVTLIIGGLLLETVLLLVWHQVSGRGLPPGLLLPGMAAGACLMLALHAVLVGAPALWLLGLLGAAGAAHVLDLWRRWPRRAAPGA